MQEVFFRAGWNPFLHLLQGYDEEILLIFAKGFDGKIARVGHLLFPVTEETIRVATKLPREGIRWHKHLFLPRSTYDFALKPCYQHIESAKGFHREWIKTEYINPLIIIICLITCEGKFNVLKSCYLCLLAHFANQQFLNFPFYFLKSLEKMLSQVRKNAVKPKGSLYHHRLIKLLILHQLKERNHT